MYLNSVYMVTLVPFEFPSDIFNVKIRIQLPIKISEKKNLFKIRINFFYRGNG